MNISRLKFSSMHQLKHPLLCMKVALLYHFYLSPTGNMEHKNYLKSPIFKSFNKANLRRIAWRLAWPFCMLQSKRLACYINPTPKPLAWMQTLKQTGHIFNVSITSFNNYRAKLTTSVRGVAIKSELWVPTALHVSRKRQRAHAANHPDTHTHLCPVTLKITLNFTNLN